MADISIRPYAEGDLLAVAALVTALGYPTTTDQMRGRMDRISGRPDHATFLAVADGRVVGMVGALVTASYEHDEPTGRLTAMVVSPQAQKRGIGAQLVAAAEAWVRDRGARRMVLTSHLRRTGAHAFYERLGYSETGRRFEREI